MEGKEEGQGLSRRRFLCYGLGFISGFVSLALGLPVIGYFVSPALRQTKVNWTAIARAEEIPVGLPTPVQYTERAQDGWVRSEIRRSAWVLTKDGKVFTVYDPRCTHLGCAYHWDTQRNQFLCPCHDGVFDINGRVVSGPPPRPLDRLEAKVEGGMLYVGRIIRVEV